MGRKKQPEKAERTSILIVTNGQVTERQYLSKLKNLVRNRKVSIAIEHIPGESVTLLRKLKSSDLSAYKEIWIVVDEDGRDQSPLVAACRKKTTSKPKWIPIVSRPCFEEWLVAHYCPVRRYQDQVDVQRHYASVTGQSASAKTLPDSFPIGNIPQAVTNCRIHGVPEEPQGEMPPSPGSGMVHLVRQLGLD